MQQVTPLPPSSPYPSGFVSTLLALTSPSKPSRQRSSSFGGRSRSTSSPEEPSRKSWKSSFGYLSSPFSNALRGKGKEVVVSGTRKVGEDDDEGFWEGLGGRRFDILSELPTEIALYVMLFLPAESQATCARVSRNWSSLASDNALWREKFYMKPGWKVRSTFAERPSSSLGRTPSSVQTVRPSKSDERVGSMNWKAIYQKRRWLENRWANSAVANEVVLKGHADSVYALQFDGLKLVTGSRDRSIKIWSISTGECLQTIENAHEASVLSIAFDEQTGFMVSGGSDCKINVWDLGGPGLPIREVVRKATIEGHSQGVLDVALSADYIVSCSKDTKVNVFSRRDLTHLRSLASHSGPVNAIAVQGFQAVSASGDGKICLWDLHTGHCVRVLKGHERGLACVDFKGDFIVSGSNDRTMKVWRASTGEVLHTLTGHDDLVRTLSFDPDSGRIVSGGYDKKILIWDLYTGRMIRSLETGHTSLVFDLQFDAGRIASSSHDKRVVVTDFGDEESAAMFT